jgi:hypothetical protein
MGYNQNYSNRSNQNYSNQNEQRFKKSGAKYTKISKGNFEGLTCVNAWKATKNGLVKCSVMPYHASNELVESERGNTYIKMIARIDYGMGQERVIPCLMNEKTHVISLDEIGMCITPNGSGQTRSGKQITGYFGTFTKR